MRHKIALEIAGFILTAIAPIALFGQSPETIPEAIARGATGRVSTPPSGRVPSIDDVLRETDMVVRGIVRESTGYLSENQQDVYTEYTISPATILYSAVAMVSPEPGRISRINISQIGGTIVLNGQKFTQTEHGLAPLKAGAEVVLLLKHLGSRWHIATVFFGAFSIENGKLRTLTTRPTFAPQVRDMDSTTAVKELLARLHSVKQ